MTLHQHIKERRISLGLSKSELARRIGYTRQSVIRIERGEKRDYSSDFIFKLANCLLIDITFLYHLYLNEKTPIKQSNTRGRNANNKTR